jgi:hypothetical protein
MTANTAFHIAVLPGDGIGPEVMAPTLEILRRIEATTPSLKFRFTEGRGGRRPLQGHREVDAGIDRKAMRGSGRYPAWRVRPAERALSRQYRDYAAG